MTNSPFNLTGLFTVLLAAPVWILVVIEFSLRSPDHYAYGPIVLCGMTVAIQRLLRPYKNAWPLAALGSGLVSLAVLTLVCRMTTRYSFAAA